MAAIWVTFLVALKKLQCDRATKMAVDSGTWMEKKVWNWARALDRVHKEGWSEVTHQLTPIFGLISCVLPLIWGTLKEDIFFQTFEKAIFSSF